MPASRYRRLMRTNPAGAGLRMLVTRSLRSESDSMPLALQFTRRLRLPLIAILLTCALIPAEANLKAGAQAPDFSAQASLGGVVSTFSLTDTLKQGPVVL